MKNTITAADLFCGAGGTSTGLVEACNESGHQVNLTAVNHWPVAVATHTANHPDARHLCASLDSLNPRDLFSEGELNILWASPECTHHSNARGGKPIKDQSRATAWCVTRWADALRPDYIFIENVPEFEGWGPLDCKLRPIASRKSETFHAWLNAIRSIGYKVDYRILCAADFGDPTTRRRLFIQAVRGRRRIVWPEPSHCPSVENDLFRNLKPWRAAKDIIDWSLPIQSIFDRKRPLADSTLRRIEEGLRCYGDATIIAMEHGGRSLSVSNPMPTITTAKGGAFGLAYVLPQQSGGALRPVGQPLPTISTAGAISLIVKYYGTGIAHPVTEPLSTITCKDRFGLAQVKGEDILFRMLQPHELAAAQGFPSGYKFSGTKTEQVKQIGNAVPKNLAKAIVMAAIRNN